MRALLASDSNCSFLQGTIFKFCINLLEKGSFCCLQMCKLPLQRNTAQDSKIQPCTSNLIKTRYFTTKALHNTQCSGDSHLSISEGPHYLQRVLCVFHKKLQVASTQLLVKQPTLRQPDCFLEALLLFPLQQGGTAIGD